MMKIYLPISRVVVEIIIQGRQHVGAGGVAEQTEVRQWTYALSYDVDRSVDDCQL